MIGIVLVNWNGWEDTIVCINSILASNVGEERVVICIVDNNSNDESLIQISNHIRSIGYPEEFTSYTRDRELDSRVNAISRFEKTISDNTLSTMKVHDIGFVVVHNNDNYGFAVANNVGVKVLDFIYEKKCNYFWLLNNDTEIEPNCIGALCKKMEANPSLGVCGSTLIYYGSDNIVQAYGGVNYSLLTGRGVTLGNGSVLNLDEINEAEIEKELTYISGASMFVRREVFDKVGLLSEDYFLYYEEIDFSCRIKDLYLQGYAADAIVYHKEGASIGTGSIIRAPSLLSDYLQTKNKILFFRKFQKSSLLIVWLMGLMKVGKRIREGYYANARVILLALFGVFIPREKLVKR